MKLTNYMDVVTITITTLAEAVITLAENIKLNICDRGSHAANLRVLTVCLPTVLLAGAHCLQQ